MSSVAELFALHWGLGYERSLHMVDLKSNSHIQKSARDFFIVAIKPTEKNNLFYSYHAVGKDIYANGACNSTEIQ